MSRISVLAIILASLFIGCGESKHEKSAEQGEARAEQAGESEGEEGEGRAALARIPASDRTAFFQLASAVGVLSQRASVVVVGRVRKASNVPALVVLRRRVAGLRPRHHSLVALRLQLIGALDRAIRGRLAPPSAKAALVASETIVRSLQRYSRENPAVSALVPD